MWQRLRILAVVVPKGVLRMLEANRLGTCADQSVQVSGAMLMIAALRTGLRGLLWAMHESRRRQAEAVLRFHPGLIAMLGVTHPPAEPSSPWHGDRAWK